MLTLFSKGFGWVYGIKCLCVNVMKWILVWDNLFNSNDSVAYYNSTNSSCRMIMRTTVQCIKWNKHNLGGKDT